MVKYNLLFSVVIQNYNYSSYIEQAINTSLSQTYQNVEVIVVDDGSTDTSADIIEAYGNRVRAIFKPNGGQASAMNAGFEACTGDYVLFLDSDDFLYEDSLAKHAEALGSGAVRSQGYVDCVDENGHERGDRLPTQHPSEGDLRALALARGPNWIPCCPPPSATAWRREVLETIFPLPEMWRSAGDGFVSDCTGLFGTVKAIDAAVAAYRVHSGSWNHKRRDFDVATMKQVVERFGTRLEYMQKVATSCGMGVSADQWLRRNWRINTLQYLLARHGADVAAPTLVEHLCSMVLLSPSKRMVGTAFVLAVRTLPLQASMLLASRVIQLHRL